MMVRAQVLKSDPSECEIGDYLPSNFFQITTDVHLHIQLRRPFCTIYGKWRRQDRAWKLIGYQDQRGMPLSPTEFKRYLETPYHDRNKKS